MLFLLNLTSVSTSDELYNHNNRPTNRHAWILFFQMPQRFQERETGNRGMRGLKMWEGTKMTKTEQANVGWRQRRIVIQSTWNIAGSSQVYFCQPKRLPGALSDRRLLCCLTRKEKKELGAGRGGEGGWPASFPPAGCEFPRGRRLFRSRDVMKLW